MAKNLRGEIREVSQRINFRFFLYISVQGDRIIFSVRGSLEANLAFSQEGFVSRLYIGTQENLVMQEYEPFPFRRLNQIGRPKLI